MQAFPVVAKNLTQRVVGRQRYTDAESSFGRRDTWIDQIVLMALVHAKVFSATGPQYTESSGPFATIVGTFPVCPTEQASGDKKVDGLHGMRPGD